MARCRADRYCSAATNASRTPARDAATVAGSALSPASSTSGIGWSHGTSVPATSWVAGSSAGAPRPGRQRPSVAAFQRGEAHIGRNAVQPGTHGRTALKPGIGPPRPQVRLLHQVFCLFGRAQHSVTMGQQLASELARQAGELFADRHHYPQIACAAQRGFNPVPIDPAAGPKSPRSRRRHVWAGREPAPKVTTRDPGRGSRGSAGLTPFARVDMARRAGSGRLGVTKSPVTATTLTVRRRLYRRSYSERGRPTADDLAADGLGAHSCQGPLCEQSCRLARPPRGALRAAEGDEAK